jgi:hypothetical protein
MYRQSTHEFSVAIKVAGIVMSRLSTIRVSLPLKVETP